MWKILRNLLILGILCGVGGYLVWWSSPLWLPYDTERAMIEFWQDAQDKWDALGNEQATKTIIYIDRNGNAVPPEQYNEKDNTQFFVTTDTLATLQQNLNTVNQRVFQEATINVSATKDIGTYLNIPFTDISRQVGGTTISSSGTVYIKTGFDLTSNPIDINYLAQSGNIIYVTIDVPVPPTVIAAGLTNQQNNWDRSLLFGGDPNKINQYEGYMGNSLFFSVIQTPIQGLATGQSNTSHLTYMLGQTQIIGKEMFAQEIILTLNKAATLAGFDPKTIQFQIKVNIPPPDTLIDSMKRQLDPYRPYR